MTDTERLQEEIRQMGELLRTTQEALERIRSEFEESTEELAKFTEYRPKLEI